MNNTIMSTREIVRIIAEERGVPADQFDPSEWVTMILGVIDDLRPRMNLIGPEMFVKLTEPLPEFEQYLARSLTKHSDVNQNARNEVINKMPLPKDFDLNKVLVMSVLWVNDTPRFETHKVLLTDQGRLMMWKMRTSDHGYSEKVHSSHLAYITAREMMELFERDSEMAYTMFYNICSIPEECAKTMSRRASFMQEVAGRFSAKRALISDPKN